MFLTKKSKVLLIVFHFLLVYVAMNFESIFRLYYVSVLLYGLNHILKKETSNHRVSHYYIAYFVGMEIFIKLSGAIVIDQFGKYSVILIILMSFIKTHKFNDLKPKIFIAFIVLMSISVVLINSGSLKRDLDLISFYLSGPLCMTLCVFYFNEYKFEFTKDFMNALFVSLLPIISIVVFCYARSGSINISEIQYGANASQSGGYGPNQVAVVLGYGIIVLFIGLIFRTTITGHFIADAFLLVLLVHRILLTFSRGGFLSAILAIILAILYVSVKSKSFVSANKRALAYMGIGFIIVVFGWFKTNSDTGNKLTQRYEGYTGSTEYDGTIQLSSGRERLIEIELDIFKKNWVMGIGPGMASTIRGDKLRGGGEIVANHTEFSRMLAEHGLYGLIALIIMAGYPIYMLRKSRNLNNSFIIVLFVSLSLLTLGHNAHRLALPSFLYGLAFVNLIKDKKNDPVLRERQKD